MSKDTGGPAMTDRELLELAAKAAGMDYLIWTPGAAPIVPSDHRINGRACWHPLTDDGDALRLAVKLGVPIDFCHASGATWAVNPWNGAKHVEPGTADMKACAAATRRAIVRAAAEIGRSM